MKAGKLTVLVADLFCGAGGMSTGLFAAAEQLDLGVDLLAVDHWKTAIETHAKNHAAAKHLCASLDRVDPSRVVPGGKLDLLIASPECVHFSLARGGKPCDAKSRAGAWHVLHWAERLRVESIIVENVREFATWGPLGADKRPLKHRKGETFTSWVAALRSLGYRVEFRLLNAADYGGVTTRTRLFVVATRRHGGLRWPEPTHGKRGRPEVFAGDFVPWRAAREIIDWSLPGESIFRRARPLAQNTLRRIEEGLKRFGGAAAEPFLVVLRNHMAGRSLGDPVPTVAASGWHMGTDEPAPTVAGAGALGLVRPFVVKTAHKNANVAYVRDADEPLYTVTTADGELGVVEPFLVPMYGERPGQVPRAHAIREPVPTIPATGGGKFGLVAPFVLAPLGIGRGNAPRLVEEPTPTATASRGGGYPVAVSSPAPTVTTKDRLGLVEAAGVDIQFRMLQPHELAAAMSFPDGYRFAGTKADVVKQIGNAVDVKTATALCAAALDR